MEATWKRIETWLEANAPQMVASLNPPATDAEIEATEKFLEVALPEDMRVIYRLRNGQQSVGHGLFSGWLFLSLQQMREEWDVWKELLDWGDFDSVPDFL